MILRMQYLERIRPLYDSELIKVAAGVRFSTTCIAPESLRRLGFAHWAPDSLFASVQLKSVVSSFDAL